MLEIEMLGFWNRDCKAVDMYLCCAGSVWNRRMEFEATSVLFDMAENALRIVGGVCEPIRGIIFEEKEAGSFRRNPGSSPLE